MRRPLTLASTLALTACAGSAEFASLSRERAAADRPAEETSSSDAVATTGAGQGAPAPSPSTEGSGTIDVPAWVNGSYLACVWSAAATAAEAAVACHVALADGSQLAPRDGLSARWTLVPVDPQAAPEVLAVGAPSLAVVLSTAEILTASLRVDLEVDGAAPAAVAAPLTSALPGLDAGSALEACLIAGRDVEACLADAGLGPQPPAPVPPAPPVPPPAGDGPQPPPDHPRAWVDGVTYYLGLEGATCSETCADYGGTHPATIDVIGSGGDAAMCNAVLLAFAPVTVLSSTTGSAGVGCHLDAGTGKHVVLPATAQAAHFGAVRRVCACMQ